MRIDGFLRKIAGVSINEYVVVRKALYRLYDHSIVALRRSREKETGWFIFN